MTLKYSTGTYAPPCMCVMLPLLQNSKSLYGGFVGKHSLFKWHFCSVLEYSNEQQAFPLPLHFKEHFDLSACVDGSPCPGISPGRALYPLGQSYTVIQKF